MICSVAAQGIPSSRNASKPFLVSHEGGNNDHAADTDDENDDTISGSLSDPGSEISSTERQIVDEYPHTTVNSSVPVSHVPHHSILKTPNNSCNSTKRGDGDGGKSKLEMVDRPRHCRAVSFETVQIRQYDMELGDHPSCSIGAPVTLSWHYHDEQIHDIDIYECECGLRRRGNQQRLILNYYRRQDILRKAGYTDDELYEAEKATAKIRRQRTTTYFLLPLGNMEEMLRSVSRKVKRRMGRTEPKRN